MIDNRNGRIVTFYSFKGGTGRTMALANVAWILAMNGKRVLVVDWDLDAPGLHRFFTPFIDAGVLESTEGVIDLVRAYQWAATGPGPREENWHEMYARVAGSAFSLRFSFPEGGTLDFMPAGRQNHEYAATLNSFDWDNFYRRSAGGQFLDALRANMRNHYDYTLIDSRTGLSDASEICTIQLPDTLVDCFTYSEQGIDGGARVAREIRNKYGKRNIRILPVAMRIDPAEKERAEISRAVAMSRFAGLPAGLSEDQRGVYWNDVQVPYQAFYAYEEMLATFGDDAGVHSSLLASYERLTGYITDGTVTTLPPMDPNERHRHRDLFVRRLTMPESQVALYYAAEDGVWAEWIEYVLEAAGVRVTTPAPGDRMPSSARRVTIVSSANVDHLSDLTPADPSVGRQSIAVYVADVRAPRAFPRETSVFVSTQPARTVAEQILKLLGRTMPKLDFDGPVGARYPGQALKAFKVLSRNARFTGREQDLWALRARMRSGRTTAVVAGSPSLPLTLQGLGGIGKTQLAIEYAHRYRSAYDVVWWIDSDPVTFIDTQLADLAEELKLPPQPTIEDKTRAVKAALESGEHSRRWLLIFDNAEEIERVLEFVPKSEAGHVLITSRNFEWRESAEILEVDVFMRLESVEHLRRRVPTIRREDAERLAEIVGDLPIVVAAAGAWLEDTGDDVVRYISEIEQRGVTAQNVDAIWDLSLKRLLEQSAAAYRLLQMCSLLAPEIALDLVYSDDFIAPLMSLDPSLSDRTVRASLVQKINRLALLKLDQTGRLKQIAVHRVLQQVVRSRMSAEEASEIRHQVHLILARFRPEGEVEEPSTWPRLRMIWPHLDTSEAVDCPDESVRQLLIERVRYVSNGGGLAQAESLAERIEKTWTDREIRGEETDRRALRRQLLQLRFNLANIIRYQGKFDAAYQLDEEVLREQTELLSEEHPNTLMTAGGLAADLRALGRYEEALNLDRKTYTAWTRAVGDNHLRTLNALNNLAASYRFMGDFREARRLDQQSYDMRVALLGPDNPNTLFAASNLGRDFREAGEYAQSVSLLRKILEALKDNPDSGERNVLNAQTNLAVSLRSDGNTAEAARMLDNSYERLTDTLGPSNPDTLACRLSRSVNLLALEDFDRAQREMEQVHIAYQETLGPKHPHTLVCINNLAAIAWAHHDYPLAYRLASTVWENMRMVLSPDHPYALASQMNLSVILAEQDDAERAIELNRDAARRLLEVLGSEHPDTLRCEANLAIVLTNEGHTEPDADEKQVLERLTRRIGKDHPATRALQERRYLHRTIDPHPF